MAYSFISPSVSARPVHNPARRQARRPLYSGCSPAATWRTNWKRCPTSHIHHVLPQKSICRHTLPCCRARRQPLSRVSRKQRYNTLDFAKQNRVPTGMLRAPIGNPASKEIAPLCTPLVLVAYEDATISQLARSQPPKT